MKIKIIDHTLCLFIKKNAFMLRPCSSIDGKFEVRGKTIPWFKVTEVDRDKSTLYLFAIPFFLFWERKVKMKIFKRWEVVDRKSYKVITAYPFKFLANKISNDLNWVDEIFSKPESTFVRKAK